jgi:hypothetical protein
MHPINQVAADANVSQYVERLNTLAKFKSLRFLTLRTRTISDDLGGNIDGSDVDLDSAKETMSHLQTGQASGMLSKFTMIVFMRLGSPGSILPYSKFSDQKGMSLIARRKFVFLRKGDDVQVEVSNQELPVSRPKVSTGVRGSPGIAKSVEDTTDVDAVTDCTGPWPPEVLSIKKISC